MVFIYQYDSSICASMDEYVCIYTVYTDSDCCCSFVSVHFTSFLFLYCASLPTFDDWSCLPQTSIRIVFGCCIVVCVYTYECNTQRQPPTTTTTAILSKFIFVFCPTFSKMNFDAAYPLIYVDLFFFFYFFRTLTAYAFSHRNN